MLADSRRPYKGRSTRQKYEFQCSRCKGWFKQTEVEVDHIVPCGSLKSFDDMPGFTERLFCGKDGLRVVCSPCHKVITNEARKDE